MRRTTTLTLTIAGLVALAGVAPAAAQDDLLRGPKARHAGPPGAARDFAPGDADMREPTPAMRHRLLMAAIRTLERDETLALDGAQRQAIEAQDRLYRAALEAYRAANAEAYESLRPERPDRPERGGDRQAKRDHDGARDGDRPGRRAPGADRAPVDPQQRERMRAAMQERMQALRALEMNAPSPADIDANIWGLLTAEQQQAVERRMERIKAAAGERMQGPGHGQREQAGGERPQRRQRDGEARLTDQQRERIRRAMEDMTPEERRAFMDELRQRMRERAPGERRPAPPMEEVEVPPPGR